MVAWADVEVTVNPNGPHYKSGSDSDNGQTGRKRVMDYYGPMVPIGGGALSGKHPAHIDRLVARDAAIRAVRTGVRECTVRLAYAPNRKEPMEVLLQMEGRGERMAQDFFNFDAMLARMDVGVVMGELGMRSWQLPSAGGVRETSPKRIPENRAECSPGSAALPTRH